MFVGITNTPRDYAWGSSTAIAGLLGTQPSGGPEAELWFGAHPASPSVVTDDTPHLAGRHLDELIAKDPARMLGPGRTRLPFLLKVLAADQPLSMQAHPNTEQAKAGFARENAAGIPLEAAERNYKDDSAKPELILALSETFEALAGFRHVSEIRMLFAELAMYATGADRDVINAFVARLAGGDPAHAASMGSSRDVKQDGMPASSATEPPHEGLGNPLRDAVEWLLRGGDDVDRFIAAVTAAAGREGARSSFAREWATAQRLATLYPGDPGIVLSLLLNHISLRQGQAIYLTAGSIHAYLQGLGMEVMASSDNVLRGGLTEKHVDVEELLHIVRFEQIPPPIVTPDTPVDGIRVFRPETDDFVLAEIALGDEAEVHGYRLSGPDSTGFTLTGPAVVVTLTGGIRVRGASDEAMLTRGDALYITPDEGRLTFSGSGVAMVATTP